MIILKQADQLTTYRNTGLKDKKIGFVPTMGALHCGHLSLVKKAKNENDIVVCSIFINPLQFNNPHDFNHYPITLEKDIEQLMGAGCDVLFLPTESEIYPAYFVKKDYDLGQLEKLFEGFYRPGHFQGVCQVVERLLEIVQPQQIYLGQKDYQQCMIIKKLIQILNKEAVYNLVVCPTIRAANGLAMSSRNLRLSADEKEKASAIYQSLLYLKDHLSEPISDIKQQAVNDLEARGFRVDYVDIVSASTLEPAATGDSQKLVGLVAASLNEVRLIDNMLLN